MVCLKCRITSYNVCYTKLLRCHDYDRTCQILCLLHDILEDTKITKDELINEFGLYITNLICKISDESGNNRKIRKELTNKKLSLLDEEDISNKYVLIVKAADRLANMIRSVNNPSLMRMYIREFPEFNKARNNFV